MTAATAQEVQYLNLAYFGRPADPASLSAWPASGLSLEEIVLKFTETAEYAANTVEPNSVVNVNGGRTFNDTNLINTFYQRLFGRLATTQEVAGWSDALAQGAVNYDYLGITILQAALNLPPDTEMRQVLIAKFDSNELYTGILYNNPEDAAAYSNEAAIQNGIAFSASTTTTTPATFAQAQAAVNQMVIDSGAETYTLTTALEALDAGTLAAVYSIEVGTQADGGVLTVNDAVLRRADVQSLIDGATNSLQLNVDNFNFRLNDLWVNLIDTTGTALIPTSDSYRLADAAGSNLGGLNPDEVAILNGAANGTEYVYTPLTETYTLTTALEAFDAGTLPAVYSIEVGTQADGGVLTVNDAFLRRADVQLLIDGATNSLQLNVDNFNFRLNDFWVNLIDPDGVAVIPSADSYRLADPAGTNLSSITGGLTPDQIVILEGAQNGAEYVFTPLDPGDQEIIEITRNQFNYVGSDFAATTFIAQLTGTFANQQTLLNQDRIDGGLGNNNNTLIASLNRSVTPASLQNVQNVEITAEAAVTLNLQNADGIEVLTNNGSIADLLVRNLDVGADLEIAFTDADFDVEFLGADGADDSVDIRLESVGVGGAVELLLDGGDGDIETANIDSAGIDPNTIGVLGGNTLDGVTTLNVAGQADFTVTNALADVITADGSEATGDLILTFAQGGVNATGGTGNDFFTVAGAGSATLIGGEGNDTFEFTANNFGATDVLDGGAGANALNISGTNANVTNANVGNVQTLNIAGAAVAAATTNISGISTINLDAGTAGAYSVVGPAGSFNINTDAALVGLLTATDTGTGTDDVLILSNTSSAGTGNVFGAVTSVGYETVNIDSGDSGLPGDAQILGAVTITPDATGSGSLTFSGANNVTTAAITGVSSIDASGLTGGTSLTMGVAAAAATSIIGSAGDDTLLASAGGSTIEGRAGDDTITGGIGNDTLLGEAGNDLITAGTGNDSIDGGADDDRIVLAANLTVDDSVDGGEGRDTAVISAAVTLVSAGSRLSNIEILETSVAAQDMQVFTNTAIDTITQTNLAGLAVTNATTDVSTLNIDASAGAMATSLQRQAAFDTTSNTLTVNANTAIAGADDTLTVNNEESLTLNTGANAVDLDVVAATLTTLDINNAAAGAAAAIVIDAQNAVNLATVDVTGVTGAAAVTVDASVSTVDLTYTGSGSTGVNTVTTGTGDDTINAGSAGSLTATSGAGSDTINGSAAGADVINAGTGVDAVSLGTAVGDAADTVFQAVPDSQLVTSTSGTGTFAIGYDLTYANGVDVVNGFNAAGGDILSNQVSANRAINALGLATNALANGLYYLSGNYNAAAGRFTATADGLGADTFIFQVNGVAAEANITTNTSAVVLVGVNSGSLTDANFDVTPGTLIVDGEFTGTVFSVTSFAAGAPLVTAVPVAGTVNIAADGTITQVDPLSTVTTSGAAFNQATVTAINAAPLAATGTVTININGAATPNLAAVTGTIGVDNFVVVDGADFGAANGNFLTGNGGADTLTITNFSTNQTDIGVGTTVAANGAGLNGITTINLSNGTENAADTLTSTATFTGATSYTITNTSAIADATVALNTGASTTYTSASSGIDNVQINALTQSASTGAGNDLIQLAAAGSYGGSYNLGTGGADVLQLGGAGTYNLEGAILTNVVILDADDALAYELQIDTTNFAAITIIDFFGGGGASDTLTLDDGNYDFSAKILAFDVAAANAIDLNTRGNGSKTLTLDAADVANVATITGETTGGVITTLNFNDTTSLATRTVTNIDVITIAGADQTLTVAGDDAGAAGNYTTTTGSGTSNLVYAVGAGAAALNLTNTTVSSFDSIDASAALGGGDTTLTLDASSILTGGATAVVVDASSNLAFTETYNASDWTLTGADAVTLSAGIDLTVTDRFFNATTAVYNGSGTGDLIVNMVGTTLDLGADTFGTGSDIQTAITGTTGNDTIRFALSKAAGSTMTVTGNGGNDTFRFSEDSGNVFADAAGGVFNAVIADAVSVNDFSATGDQITGLAADLNGVGGATAAVAQNAWNLNNTGFALITGSAQNDFSNEAGVIGAVGTITGDAGDTAYFAIQNVDGSQVGIYIATLDNAKVGAALDGDDDISLIGVVDVTSGVFGAANIGLF